ncbi:MAG: UDP-2,3-diacylglucosamine diphosphatase [Flavobacteriia bacterium]|nr:UDP-2,3-diacylglucosamine diphosphatase [Flavobacteriia bacterium]
MPEKIAKNIYFASDFHLGAPSYEKSLIREKQLVAWLTYIEPSAKEIYLVGDIFDFWFEYKHAIPKGFVRLQGKIAQLTDSGIPVHVFTGNHDMWIFDYLPKELGIILHKEPLKINIGNKKIYIGHGDGLGPGDHTYKFLKRFFASKFCQWAFARLHPNFGIWLANKSSKKSRAAGAKQDEKFLGEENEWLAIYSKEILRKEHFDYFIFGHRHLPLKIEIGTNSTYYNLGEWLNFNTYLVLNDGNVSMKSWKNNIENDFTI